MTYNPLGRRRRVSTAETGFSGELAQQPMSPVAPESAPNARRLPMTFDYTAHQERMLKILYPQPKTLTDEGLPNLAENIKKMAAKKR